jgi:hypothetical protein
MRTGSSKDEDIEAMFKIDPNLKINAADCPLVLDGEMERWRDGEMERWRDGEREMREREREKEIPMVRERKRAQWTERQSSKR